MKTLDKGPSCPSALCRLPGWALGWFYATAAICTWDASFIVLRPHSLPGGGLHWLWKPYYLYIALDGRYLDIDDPFVYGISLFNYAEVVLNIITIFMHHRNSRHTIPLAFTVCTMTFWKTLFYFYGFSYLGGGGPYRQGNSALAEFLLVVIPNGIWLILPFAVMAALWPRIIPAQLPAKQEFPVPSSEGALYNDQNGVKGDSYYRYAESGGRRVREEGCHAKHA